MLLLRWIYAMAVRSRGLVSLLIIAVFSLWISRFEPLQRDQVRRGMLGTIFLPVHSVVSAFRVHANMTATIAKLQQDNAQMLVHLSELRDMSSENDRLRDLLGLPHRLPYRLLAAEVLARQSVRPLGSWVINRGREAGVEEGMAVMAPKGLIGRVIEAGHGYSLVQVLTDPDCRVAVIDLRSRHSGTLYSPDGMRLVTEANVNSDYRNGDTIVTWGAGGVFPKGLPVGIVLSSDPHAVGALKQCLVRPFQDLTTVENVFLVMHPSTLQMGMDQLPARGFEIIQGDTTKKDSVEDTLRAPGTASPISAAAPVSTPVPARLPPHHPQAGKSGTAVSRDSAR